MNGWYISLPEKHHKFAYFQHTREFEFLAWREPRKRVIMCFPCVGPNNHLKHPKGRPLSQANAISTMLCTPSGGLKATRPETEAPTTQPERQRDPKITKNTCIFHLLPGFSKGGSNSKSAMETRFWRQLAQIKRTKTLVWYKPAQGS